MNPLSKHLKLLFIIFGAVGILFSNNLFNNLQVTKEVNTSNFSQEKFKMMQKVFAHTREINEKTKTKIKINNNEQQELSIPTILNDNSLSAEDRELNQEEKNIVNLLVDYHNYPKDIVLATGYTAGYESTGKDRTHPQYGITYSGVKVRRDFVSTIAADPAFFPIGTLLYIPGYGYGIVADTGSAIKGKHIDLYYETVDEVFNKWGKKSVEVYLIKKGNGNLSEQDLKELNQLATIVIAKQNQQKFNDFHG